MDEQFVPQEFYDLMKEEVMFLRMELGKTRNLLGDILKSQFSSSEFSEKTRQLLHDSIKSRANPTSTTTDDERMAFLLNSPTVNTTMNIPTVMNDTIVEALPSHDWNDETSSDSEYAVYLMLNLSDVTI